MSHSGARTTSLGLIVMSTMALVIGAACKSVPVTPIATAPPPAPVVSMDQKMGWILRLEQQRTLRDDAGSAGTIVPSTMTPAMSPDLQRLALDPDARVRRRALVAIGRIADLDGVPLLGAGLHDTDPDVRAAAAFALGLVGQPAGVPLLQSALAADASDVVRARAIDALGLIGDVAGAAAIVTASAGCPARLAPIEADDEAWPKAPEIEVCRAALFALARLKQYDALRQVALDGQGSPVSTWWPVAYALQRVGDPRAAPALVPLASSTGVYTASYAMRGLAAAKDARVLPIAVPAARKRDADVRLRVAAVRALGLMKGAPAAVSTLLDMLAEPATSPNLAIEVVTALGELGAREAFDPLVDLLSDTSPTMRAAAMAAAAKCDPDGFLLILSGLVRDRDWTVRAAQADVLSHFPADRVAGAIEDLATDEDARVHGSALEALAAVKAPSLAAHLVAALGASDYVERATAARLVGTARLDGGVDLLVKAYGRAESDSAFDARVAALEGLAALGGPNAIATLRRGLSDREWVVRYRAAVLLGRLQQTASAERPAPMRHAPEFFESPALLHPAYSPHAFIDTRLGAIEIQLDVVNAPVTVRTFIEQARAGFFDGMRIHRVVPAFVVQVGDPRGDGNGGPGYSVRDEFSEVPFLRGTVGMATDGTAPEWRDSGGSQFFVALGPQPHLDGKYAVLGRVVGGWDVLDVLTATDVIDRVRVWDGVEFK